MIQCYKCAFKHVSTARRIGVELLYGYKEDTQHISDFIGELSCAADHIILVEPDLSDGIRQLRALVLDQLAEGRLTSDFSAKLDDFADVIFNLVKDKAKEKS
jgi:hypothetical protein